MDTHYVIIEEAEVESTQDVARAAAQDADRSVLVIASRQSSGRGRDGREWLEPTAGMFSSFAFVPGWDSVDHGRIPLCAAVAVRRALPVEVDLKWPNDLILEGRKVGGILVESDGNLVVVGCGVNLWWPDAPEFAGAILDGEPGPAVRRSIAEAWVEEFVGILAEPPARWPIDAYRSACVTLGQRVRWDGGIGTAMSIDDAGALRVETDGRVETVLSGDVHLLGDS